jgi:cell wall-associated NlpC family hydrolase
VYRPSFASASASASAVIAAALLTPSLAAAQQSDLAISPFVSFLPAVGGNPLAGLAFTLAGNGGLGLRGSAHVALDNSPNSGLGASSSIRPWGADADAVFSLGRAFGGYSRGLAPFVFAGIGTAATDSVGLRITRTNWSYGAGAAIPLGRVVDIFGEARWRMSRYVLPTAASAPTPTNEIRVGLSFHVGGSGPSDGRMRARDRRSESTPSVMLPTARFPAPSGASASAQRVIGTAERYIGAPYKWGGTSPSGFDCSGFVQYVFAKQGVSLPRTARQQAQVGTALAADWRAVSPGDLVMFEENGRIGHVAIYAGRNRIIHSSSSGGGVRYDDLSTERGDWFVDHMVAARRVTPDARGLLLDLARGFANGTEVQFDAPDHAPRPR